VGPSPRPFTSRAIRYVATMTVRLNKAMDMTVSVQECESVCQWPPALFAAGSWFSSRICAERCLLGRANAASETVRLGLELQILHVIEHPDLPLRGDLPGPSNGPDGSTPTSRKCYLDCYAARRQRPGPYRTAVAGGEVAHYPQAQSLFPGRCGSAA
jgi:hypothetical protein